MEREKSVIDGYWNVLGSYDREEWSGIKYHDCAGYNDFIEKTNAWWYSLSPDERVKCFTEAFPIP